MADAGLLEIVDTEKKISTGDGDHDLFAHYISKVAMEKAMLDGIPATALCGKKWLPSRDAQRYPVCVECKDVYESMPLPPGE